MKYKNQLGVSRTQKGGNNGFPINPEPKEARPKPEMDLKEARKWAAGIRSHDMDGLTPHSQAIVILDNRVIELKKNSKRLAQMAIERNKENSSLLLRIMELEAEPEREEGGCSMSAKPEPSPIRIIKENGKET